MRNRVRRALYGLAAGVAVTTALGLTAAGTASAATAEPRVHPAATWSCGPTCINPYTQAYGPFFVLNVNNGLEHVGNKIDLFDASNYNEGQDWTIDLQGSVRRLYYYGLVSANLALHYGHMPAFELEFTPLGIESGLCQGTAGTAVNGEKVSLQTCGNDSRTIWVLDFRDAPIVSGIYVPVIAGSDTNFSDPQVLTAPGSPYLASQPQLITRRLQTFATGSVNVNQMWWAFPGEVGSI
jgi:hypothetical protein